MSSFGCQAALPTDIYRMITLYGIPNCDTVKKARTWLAGQQRDFTFHDFKKQGLDEETVRGWLKSVDWEVLVNKKGTTWRGLPDERKAAVTSADAAVALMLENPSVIKRPVLVGAGPRAHVGFNDAMYQEIFSA
jgi:arsenate reductase (glutaredoxin)